MSKKTRDFYHIQDRLPIAWRYLSAGALSHTAEISALSASIEEQWQKLQPASSEMRDFYTLTSRKIEVLEGTLRELTSTEDVNEQEINNSQKLVEASLSSSGLGFFSERIAEEDEHIEITLFLDTVGTNLCMHATVLESRVSADSENPGYWIRVRFARNQDKEIDQLLAHVTQRQIERLSRSQIQDGTN